MRQQHSGFSLMEVVIAIAVIGIFFASATFVFFSVGRGIMVTRTRTVATNLAQERIESLKNVSYPRLRVTAQNDILTYGFDNTFYPPESGILVGDIAYVRKVLIQRVRENAGGQLEEALPDAGDTGMKKITVTVSWTENGQPQSYSLANVSNDSNRRALDGTIAGTIKNQDTLASLSGVRVSVVDNLNWNATSDTGGTYSIKVPTGTYQVKATKDGYWPYYSPSLTVTAVASPHDFNLKKMATGTVTGYVFVNDHVVISKVVSSTETALGEDLEWVELYNPTTFSFTIDNNFCLTYVDATNNLHFITPSFGTPLIIVSTALPPSRYYLIANTGTVVLGGYSVTADAKYSGDIIDENNKGAVQLQWGPSWNVSEAVGWAPTTQSFGYGEPPIIDHSQGLDKGKTHIRYSRPGYYSSSSGSAYDSNQNKTNFFKNLDLGISSDYYPRNSAVSASPIAGTPVAGAIITCSDGLSSAVTSYFTDASGYRLAYFQLTNVATGTWTASASFSSATYNSFREVTNVQLLSAGQTVGIPNTSTTPAWPSGYPNYLILTAPLTTGIVTGTVRSGSTNLTGIRVESGTSYALSGSGNFSLPLAPGTYNITANPGNLDPSYVSQIIENVTVTAGQIISGINFDLSQGGSFSGRVVSNSFDNLPDVLVIAYDHNGNEARSALTQANGTYVISNLATSGNPYTVRPILDSGESSSPDQDDADVIAGDTVAVATFTVTSAYGTIKGNVTFGGASINTGVLILATTGTIAADPPDFDDTLRGSGLLFYGTASHSDGTYTLPVRGGNTYNVYAWYSMMSGGTSQTTRKSSLNRTVNASGNVTADFSWP